MKPLAFVMVAGLGMLALMPAAPDSARGCAPAFRIGTSVAIASESAIIIWDADKKTQHFIRRASFDTETPDFGFLVPTPSKPTLTEAPDALFKALADWTKPEKITQTVRTPYPGGRSMMAGKAAPAPGAVAVLGEQHVAGMDAVILKATNAKALTDWLMKHGYEARPALTDWVRPYIEKKWIFTAFKFAKTHPTGRRVAPKAVRMSFATEKPFYPYSEPADMRAGGFSPGRMLRIFFVGSARMVGTLGETGGPWPAGNTAWAGPLSKAQRSQLFDKLELEDTKLPDEPWLTVLEDSSSPRAGTDDVFFKPAALQTTVRRPPIVDYVYRDGRQGVEVPRAKLGIVFGASAAVGAVILLVWWLLGGRIAREEG